MNGEEIASHALSSRYGVQKGSADNEINCWPIARFEKGEGVKYLRVIFARNARARSIDGTEILSIAGVVDGHRSFIRQYIPHSSRPCRKHTVEHVDPKSHAHHQIQRIANNNHVNRSLLTLLPCNSAVCRLGEDPYTQTQLSKTHLLTLRRSIHQSRSQVHCVWSFLKAIIRVMGGEVQLSHLEMSASFKSIACNTLSAQLHVQTALDDGEKVLMGFSWNGHAPIEPTGTKRQSELCAPD